MSRSVQTGILVVAIAVSVAAPWLVHRAARTSLREREARLQQQSARLAQLAAENQRLSNLATSAGAPELSAEQLRELLKLRGQVGALRDTVNTIQRLREENRVLESRSTNAQYPTAQNSPAEVDAQLSAETIEAMSNICRLLPQAMELFARDHNGQPPTDFLQLRDYFPKPGGHRITGLYTFDFVRDNGPLPADTLILREMSARQKPDDQWARVYGFADGRAVEATSDDREFRAWEKQHLGPPPAD